LYYVIEFSYKEDNKYFVVVLYLPQPRIINITGYKYNYFELTFEVWYFTVTNTGDSVLNLRKTS